MQVKPNAILADDSTATVVPIYAEVFDLTGLKRLGPDPGLHFDQAVTPTFSLGDDPGGQGVQQPERLNRRRPRTVEDREVRGTSAHAHERTLATVACSLG